MSWTLCIDFGTTNTAAAFTDDTTNTPTPIELGAGQELMPSGVFVESPDALFAGERARDAGAGKPNAYVSTPKRAVGFPVISVNSYDLEPDVVVATVFREVLERAAEAHTAATGDTSKPNRLILTHPADWAPDRIRVLFDAAGWLGFDREQVQVVSESQAVLFGAAGTNPLPPGTKFAVFDLGASALSVSVLAANPNGTFDVLASGADSTVGGANFDATIRRWVDGQLHQQYPAVLDRLRGSANPADLRSLEVSITAAKEALSVHPSASIDVPGGVRLELSRQEFEALIHGDLVKAGQAFEAALRQAGVAPAGLQALYLAGGSAHIPAVRQMLAPLSPPVVTEQNRTVIAIGALVAAARGQGSGYPAEPVRTSVGTFPGSAPTGESASSNSRRWIWIAAAAVAAVVVIGGGALALTGGDGDAVASTASDPVADEAAAKDLITRYVETADTGGPDEMNPMRCAEKQWVLDAEHPLPPEGVEHSVENVGTVSITGDKASARVRFVETADGQDKTLTYVMSLEREDGEWKLCSARPQ